METPEKTAVAKTPVIANGRGLSLVDLLTKVEGMDLGDKIESKYLSFSDDKTKPGIPMGVVLKCVLHELTQINGMGEKRDVMVDAVNIVLRDPEDGQVKSYVNADAVIVGFAKRSKLPTPVAITWTGWEKGVKGEYRNFTFNSLVQALPKKA